MPSLWGFVLLLAAISSTFLIIESHIGRQFRTDVTEAWSITSIPLMHDGTKWYKFEGTNTELASNMFHPSPHATRTPLGCRLLRNEDAVDVHRGSWCSWCLAVSADLDSNGKGQVVGVEELYFEGRPGVGFVTGIVVEQSGPAIGAGNLRCAYFWDNVKPDFTDACAWIVCICGSIADKAISLAGATAESRSQQSWSIKECRMNLHCQCLWHNYDVASSRASWECQFPKRYHN